MIYEMFLSGLADGLQKIAEEADETEEEKMTPLEVMKARLRKKSKKGKDEDEEEKEEGEKEASAFEIAFFDGLLDELEKSAGWRDLGAGRIAKMKQRLAEGLKSVRGKALKSLQETGQTGTPLYSAGAARGGRGKFYESTRGGFKERRRKAWPERREGGGYQARIRQAMEGRGLKPSLGRRAQSWAQGIREKVTGAARGAAGAARGAAGAVRGAAEEAGRQAKGVGGAVAGAAKGALQGATAGASQGRQAAMASPERKERIQSVARKIRERQAAEAA